MAGLIYQLKSFALDIDLHLQIFILPKSSKALVLKSTARLTVKDRDIWAQIANGT